MNKGLYSTNERDVCGLLKTTPEGLASVEAAGRLAEYGENVLQKKAAVPIWRKVAAQFTHTLALLLWLAGILAIFSDQISLGIACFLVVLINAAFSFWQEYRAEQAVESLAKILPRKARVLRDGEEQEIDAETLVPGDIVMLEAGNSVSADARLLEVMEMRVDNSTLTGESEPQIRRSEAIDNRQERLVDLPNFVFASTNVVTGNGKAVVYATGMATEIGKIASLTQEVKEAPSPLQIELGNVSRAIAAIAVSVGFIFFVLGYFVVHLSRTGSFVFAIGLIVANVPEGLLPTVSLALAMGTKRMTDRHSLIKKLSSVETLGSTTVICTDKTGTLTTNEMTVCELWVNGKVVHVSGAGYEPAGDFKIDGRPPTDEERDEIAELARIASFCNNSRLCAPRPPERDRWTILGDPTEAALMVLAKKAGFEYEEKLREYRRYYELPFDSRRKMMTTIHKKTGAPGNRAEGSQQVEALVKGAPQEVLSRCSAIWRPGGPKPITEEEKAEILERNDKYARRSLRVLGFAYREMGDERKHYEVDETERDMVFVGLAAMLDPPRKEIKEALARCRTAGIRVIMITGDYGVTAESIARGIGLVQGTNVRVVSGVEIDGMSEDDLEAALDEPDLIFARVSPEHKMRVALALKSRGEIVAMTGDGVNDAPAIKVADIGVAMGIVGTDVAREAADMILTDDNFASIVSAVEEGRAIYDNIRRFITYIITHNIAEVIPCLLYVMIRIPLPLLAMQMLAIDLGSDLVPALALGAEKPESDVMLRPPRSRKDRLLNKNTIARAYGFLGIIEGAAAMAAFFFVFLLDGWRPSMGISSLPKSGHVYMMATTACFAGIVITQIGNGLSCRSNRESIFKVGFFTNRFYLWGIVSEGLVLLALVYVPGLKNVFRTAHLSGYVWLFMLIGPVVIFFAEEGRKAVVRRVHGTGRDTIEMVVEAEDRKAA
ncbi:MAG: ATPase [Candidatus Anoxymicrobium japonicum]|uniref:ATPase n=1 Tax=Candidatus Anoxymicrobium japonicum TaxID=2013648 RepID=A0A2N3G6D5_9ACTN|nr:MAG: ATPase [Candidatus Anoxymicrobium japonicum]